jgi:acyl dehydratase
MTDRQMTDHPTTMGRPPRKFAELTVGETIETARRTVTEAHVVLFAGLTGDFHPVHTDEEFAKGTLYGGRIAHGPLIFSMCTGLFIQADPLDSIAFLGMDWQLLKPVMIGDTIHVRSTLDSTRITSSGDKAIVQHTREVVNQRQDVVHKGITKIMMLI